MQSRSISLNDGADCIAALLGITATQAYKKLTMHDGGWTLSQLDAMAQQFNVTLVDLLAPRGIADSEEVKATWERATWDIGDVMPCEIQVGPKLNEDLTRPPLVAVAEAGEWEVHDKPPRHTEAYAVSELRIKLPAPKELSAMPRIAFVDDDHAALQAEALSEFGFRATGFATGEAFLHALTTDAFDAYILDWFLGDVDSAHIIDKIREIQDDSVPILVLTGVSEAYEAALFDTLQKNKNIHYFSKPTPFSILALKLKEILPRNDKNAPPTAS